MADSAQVALHQLAASRLRAEGKRTECLHHSVRNINDFRPVQGWWKEQDRMTQTVVIEANVPARHVVYGSQRPPTLAEALSRAEARIESLKRLLDSHRRRGDQIHAELDRLGVPEVRWDADVREPLIDRIRRLACGTTDGDAQPVLLQEWAPEVWSGERLVPKPRGEAR